MAKVPASDGNNRVPGSSGHSVGSWLGHHRVVIVEGMFLSYIVLNIVDLWTSAVAIGGGLEEGNWIVILISNYLGLQVFSGLALIKTVAIIGGLIATIKGIRTEDPVVRRTAIAVVIFVTLLMFAVTINNLAVLGI